MKPDGTPTIEEVCAMMEQLQSWERAEVVRKSSISLADLFRPYSAREIESNTAYYVYEEEREEPDEIEIIKNAYNSDLIGELKRRGNIEYIY